MNFCKQFSIPLAIAIFSILLHSGCTTEKHLDTDTATTEATPLASADHSGWWCVEHAIPEDECSMCSAKVATERREAGDWCEEHNRAKSQCFKCDPALAEKYAKLYEAKYGKQPPAAID